LPYIKLKAEGIQTAGLPIVKFKNGQGESIQTAGLPIVKFKNGQGEIASTGLPSVRLRA
jgi:hypothetical protein